MANSIVKLCIAGLAGSLIGVSYEKWRAPPTASLEWPNLFTVASASSSPPVVRPPSLPSGDRGGDSYKKKILPSVDPKLAAEFLKIASRYGLPSKDNLRLFNDFLISYDRRLRNPIWVMEHLNSEKLDGSAKRDNSDFLEDTTLHEYFRAKLKDFRGSGFDRGHMAAAGNHKTAQDAMDQTFALSNIVPQEREFNQGGWEVLESYVRWRAKESKNLYCVTGPLYLPKRAKDGNTYVKYRVIGDTFVAVPTHFFKVILFESKQGTMHMEAFLMPNDKKLGRKIDLDDYRVNIDRLDTIERASGMIFFDQLPRGEVGKPTAIPSGFKPRIYHDKPKIPIAA